MRKTLLNNISLSNKLTDNTLLITDNKSNFIIIPITFTFKVILLIIGKEINQ